MENAEQKMCGMRTSFNQAQPVSSFPCVLYIAQFHLILKVCAFALYRDMRGVDQKEKMRNFYVAGVRFNGTEMVTEVPWPTVDAI